MEVMEQLGIPLGEYHWMLDHILTWIGKSRAELQPAAINNATDTSIELYQANEFLLGYDCYRFGKLIEELHNDYAIRVEKT